MFDQPRESIRVEVSNIELEASGKNIFDIISEYGDLGYFLGWEEQQTARIILHFKRDLQWI